MRAWNTSYFLPAQRRPAGGAPAARQPRTAVIHLWLALLLLAGRLPAAAQAPAWQSARTVAEATTAAGINSFVTATAVDAAGNVFLAGRFKNTVILGNSFLTSLGGYDLFVAKFSPASNQFVWAQRAGSTSDDEATALALSGASAYVAGHFQGSTANFGFVTLTNAGLSDVVLELLVALVGVGEAGLWAGMGIILN